MTRVTFASHPYLLGFEQLDRLVERTAKSGNEGYPPYNIEQRSEAAYRITLAVAGFAEEDLAITVESNQLVIRGRQAEDAAERVFLHRGIAARQFQRSFVLADGVEVTGAHLENGLLHIDLARAEPETIVRTIRINGQTARSTARNLKEADMTDFPSFHDETDAADRLRPRGQDRRPPGGRAREDQPRSPLRDPRAERRGARARSRPRAGLRRRAPERVLAGQRPLTPSSLACQLALAASAGDRPSPTGGTAAATPARAKSATAVA